MSGGLVALLDDVAALVRLTAASLDDVGAAAGRASVKAAGVVVDDTAVTPRYVHGLEPNRELAIIGRIAKGSLRNKILFILPTAMLLSQFAPWAVTPILMLGAVYLCFEGAEKLLEHFGADEAEGLDDDEPVHEKTVISGAIRTDFILSAEIMVIALNEVAEQAFVSRLLILVVVAIFITALVYGVVAVIVKMDDLGLSMRQRGGSVMKAIGTGLVRGMPKLLTALATIGIAAMLWVGGHILLSGADKLGWEAPYNAVHHVEHLAHEAVPVVGGVLGWFANSGISAVLGIIVGALVVGALHVLPIKHH